MAGNNDSKAKKGLPKRAASSHPKHAKRMGHKARAAKKHAARRVSNDLRALRNAELREAGISTPWEAAKEARRLRRHASV